MIEKLTTSPAALPAAKPLFIWLAIQIVALLLAASPVPFAARMQLPRDYMAAQILSAAQIAASAMLFPFLLRDWRSALMVLITLWPFTLAAGFLAGSTHDQILFNGCFVSAWLLVLFAWRRALPTMRSELLGAAAATLVTIGGAAGWYFRAEFSEGNTDTALRLLQATPLVAAVSATRHVAPIAFLAITIILALPARYLLLRTLGSASR